MENMINKVEIRLEKQLEKDMFEIIDNNYRLILEIPMDTIRDMDSKISGTLFITRREWILEAINKALVEGLCND